MEAGKIYKFRAWDKENSLMLPVERIDYDRGRQLIVYVILPNGDENIIKYDVKTNSIPIMQYTGLKDKNGVEIYEGDIVEWEVDANGRKSKMAVVWENVGGTMRTIPYINNTTEVIGNIYENPELLNSVKE